MAISRFIRSAGVTLADAQRFETSTQSEHLKSCMMLPHEWQTGRLRSVLTDHSSKDVVNSVIEIECPTFNLTFC